MGGVRRGMESMPMVTLEELTQLLLYQMIGERNRAFLAALYLTGARVSELLKELRPSQLEIQEHRGIKFLVFKNLIVLKRNRKGKNKDKVIPMRPGKKHYVPAWTRNMVVPYNEREASMINIFIKYAEKQPPDKPLFDFSRQRAWQLTQALVLPNGDTANDHWFRHVRTSHLVTMYELGEADLIRLMGWKSADMPHKYTHLNQKDVMNKMVR